ncbi:MAG TPA: sigma 54-interacting transcriptional regulator, partial [Candidatus Deferrimicrobiaceae bacterium]
RCPSFISTSNPEHEGRAMPPHILVVDDEESIRYTFQHFLTEQGYTVSCAADCDEGIALLRKDGCDLLFADIILPGGSGIELLKEARQILPDALVIMITGAPSVDTAAESMRMGAFDYVVKPVRQDALLKTVSVALKHKAVREEREQCRLHFETIFRSVNDGIITVDRNMAVMEINNAARQICDFGGDEVIGKPLQELATRCNGSCIGALGDALAARQPVELRFIDCRSAPGKQQVVSVTASPLLGGKNRFAGAAMVVRNETRLVSMERTLQGSREIDAIVGLSKSIEKVRAMIRDLADVRTTVLITGESGTGKELVVNALHHWGQRRQGPLVKVNCAALSENLLESELFGHVAGAFTGAVKEKVGRFQRADGGTIFLDEIGETTLRMQLRLLRVIETMEFERVGDATPIKVDVRLVAATNRDLQERVAAGEFREDLYYRLKVAQIHVPPLRDRRDDILLLAEHFRGRFNRKLGKGIKGISSDVERMFLDYPWRGNVRELENLLEHSFVRCRQNVITAENLPSDFLSYFESRAPSAGLNPEEEALAIRKALEQSGGNKAEAARLLGMSRRTIYRKLERLDTR